MALTGRQKAAQTVYGACLLICRLVMMNVLWVAYTLMGLVVCGIVPAAVAVVDVFRAYEREGDTFGWAKRSWGAYRKAFVRFAPMSFVYSLALAGAMLGWQVLSLTGNAFSWLALLLVVYLFGLFLPFLAANEVNFEVTRMALVRNSLQLPLVWPLTSLKILLTEVAVVLICWALPGLIPVMAVSVPLFLASAFLTLRWSKQLRSLGRAALPVDREQDRAAGVSTGV